MNRLSVAVIAVALLASPAAAEPFVVGAQAREWTISHADLDLTRDRDADIMLARLQRAAEIVCALPELDRPSLAARRAVAACEAETLAEAVRRLDAPLVRQRHDAARTTTVASIR